MLFNWIKSSLLKSPDPDIRQTADMEDSSNSIDVGETNVLPLWEAPPHNCCVGDQNNVDGLRRRIKYYFMNPCEKYHARGRKPWKLLLQLVKIAIVTAQLVSFGLSNQMVVTFKEENLMTFKHLFLKNHVDGDAQSYAVYRQADVYEYLSYIIEQYTNLYNLTLGNHEYEKDGDLYSPLSMCQMFYRNGSVYAANETFEIDAEIDEECIELFPMHHPSPEDVMSHFTLHFKRLVSVTVTFVLKAINLQTVRYRELPDCYDFIVIITFNNKAHSGRIKIDMELDVSISECRDWEIIGASAQTLYLTEMFDCLIIVTCITSFVLCTRSVVTGIRLQYEYTQYCRSSSGKDAPWSDKLEFVSGWYILIIVSDTLSIIGSILKIEIQNKVVTSYDICSIFLGTGTMLVWIGVIRYMGYFKKYNILILTLRAALPNVIRFICCAGIIYLGYCFCGWIVIGPYHEKFRTLNTVSECLFSLINGDDMFPTFKDMKQKSSLVWVFSRIYLYSFVSLFIYMILSLFITIITDTYSTIKQLDQSGAPTSQLQEFLSMCNDLPNSGVYRLDQSSSGCCFHFLSRFRKDEQMLTSDA